VGPLDAIRDKIDGPDHTDREKALWAAYDVLMTPRVTWGSPEARPHFRSEAGIEQQARVILRWHHPEVANHDDTLRALLNMVSRENAVDYWTMVRAWLRLNPLDEVKSLLGIDDREPGSMSYPEAIAEVIQMTGYDLDRIALLHLSQFNLIRSGGKPHDPGTRVAPKSGELGALARQRRERYRREKGGD
jgi:hypothetical protein